MVPGAMIRGSFIAFAVALAACAAAPDDATSEAHFEACGGANEACCGTAPRCSGDLGCSKGTCRSINADMVAYTEYCKEQLGFTNPSAKLPFMSCFDAALADGTRAQTGRQAQLTLSIRGSSGTQVFRLRENGPLVIEGRDTWDAMFGSSGHTARGCDQPNYLQDRCDPYYRLNVFAPDPANPDIKAVIHCRSDGRKPTPASAVEAAERRRAYEASTDATPAERERLFDQWNDSNEIVLTMTNLRSGKACFFHAKSPYFGSHFPAPDDETDLASAGAVDRIWNELPVRPPFSKDDPSHRYEWVRNGENAWQRPDYMRCVGCHDSGPFMHDPFIDSMNEGGVDYLPRDRATRPYIPLGYQGAKTFLKTGPVRSPSGEVSPQRCTTCHSMGNESQCWRWFDRAVGWASSWSASEESRRDEALKRYMPLSHGAASTADFYAEYGPSIDAMKCCCEHPSWRGCKTVPAATPTAAGVEGTDTRSCTDPTCGGWGQACCGDASCNHWGLRCITGSCRFVDE
jgi:hypothetical protein